MNSTSSGKKTRENEPDEEKSYAVFNNPVGSNKIESISVEYDYVEAYQGKTLVVLLNDDFPVTKGIKKVYATIINGCSGEIIMLYPKPTGKDITLSITPKSGQTITVVKQLYWDGNDWNWIDLDPIPDTRAPIDPGSWTTKRPLDCIFCIS
jgi:hypothetical protein